MPNNPRAVDNLIPAKKGEVRNPKGKPKGTKHIATWIQEMLNDEEFETTLLDSKTGLVEYKGAPLKAIIKVAIHKSIHDPKTGNAWAEWLGKHGWGNKLVHTLDEDLFDLKEFTIKVVHDRADTDAEQETGDSSEPTE